MTHFCQARRANQLMSSKSIIECRLTSVVIVERVGDNRMLRIKKKKLFKRILASQDVFFELFFIRRQQDTKQAFASTFISHGTRKLSAFLRNTTFWIFDILVFCKIFSYMESGYYVTTECSE